MENQKGEEREDSQPAPQQSRGKKGTRRIVCVLLALFIAAVGFAGGWFGYYYSLDEEMRTFIWALGVSKRNYYQEIDGAELYERLYDLLNLDPYSKLYTPDEYAEYRAEGQGQNVGVGLSIANEATENGTFPRVFIINENSPASRAGVRKGMYVFGFGLSESELKTGDSTALASYIREQSGEFILRCGYETDGSDAENYTMKRESYQAAFVHYRDSETSFRFRGETKLTLTETNEPIAGLDGKTAYIRLDEFSGNAAAEFEECLSKMKERGRENLVLDLRTNGGGYLDILAEIAGYLLRNAEGSSPVVAKAIYRSGKEKITRAKRNIFSRYFEKDARVYVLADENTASASECLIGALVDYGTVSYENIYLRQNGEGVAKTYGKGIMQTHFSSVSGATMKLTTAEIVWPSGKSIHGVGVVPNDGATAVPADLIWGKIDPMLEFAISRI